MRGGARRPEFVLWFPCCSGRLVLVSERRRESEAGLHWRAAIDDTSALRSQTGIVCDALPRTHPVLRFAGLRVSVTVGATAASGRPMCRRGSRVEDDRVVVSDVSVRRHGTCVDDDGEMEAVAVL